MLSSFKLTAPRRGILGKKNWGLHSRERPSPQLSVSQGYVCHTALEAELAWGCVVGMLPGRVMLTRAKKWQRWGGGVPGPACDEHGNRVGNQLSHLPLAGSVANSHSRGVPGN